MHLNISYPDTWGSCDASCLPFSMSPLHCPSCVPRPPRVLSLGKPKPRCMTCQKEGAGKWHGQNSAWGVVYGHTPKQSCCPTRKIPGSMPSSNFSSTMGRPHVSAPLGQAGSPLRFSPENQHPHPASNSARGHPHRALTMDQPQRIPMRRRVDPGAAPTWAGAADKETGKIITTIIFPGAWYQQGAIAQASEGDFER